MGPGRFYRSCCAWSSSILKSRLHWGSIRLARRSHGSQRNQRSVQWIPRVAERLHNEMFVWNLLLCQHVPLFPITPDSSSPDRHGPADSAEPGPQIHILFHNLSEGRISFLNGSCCRNTCCYGYHIFYSSHGDLSLLKIFTDRGSGWSRICSWLMVLAASLL